MRLSEHFTLRELTLSQAAVRRGIDNTPDAAAVENLKRLCQEVLEPVRARFRIPFSPSSGYRSSRLNRLIGGSRRSQHMRGEAADFEVPTVPNLTLAQWIADTLEFDQLILEFPRAADADAGWIHCSLTAGANRRTVLTRTHGGYLPGLPEQIR